MPKIFENFIIRIAVCGVIGSATLICLSEILRLGFASYANEIPSVSVAQSLPNINGNCNAVGQNNAACNTVIAPNRLSLSSQLTNELLSKMPIKKTVNLTSVGSAKDQSVGDEVQSFLVKNGYNVNRTTVGMLIPPPDNKVSLRETADAYNLLVAPSANQ